MPALKTLKIAAIAASTALGALMPIGHAIAEVQLGDISVMSQRGQRLKLALPYGSNPGERVPLLRFTVEDIQVPDGFTAPAARGFTMMQGANRNMVILQSREKFDAPSLTMLVKVANQADGTRSYQLNVPVQSQALTDAPSATAKTTKAKRGKAKARSYKRKITAQDLPPK
jgi:hypothetical protein